MDKDERIEKVTQAAVDAIEGEAETWMPQSRREKLTPYVKWQEGTASKSMACRTQADAERMALELLQRSDISEVYLVLHIQKVK